MFFSELVFSENTQNSFGSKSENDAVVEQVVVASTREEKNLRIVSESVGVFDEEPPNHIATSVFGAVLLLNAKKRRSKVPTASEIDQFSSLHIDLLSE